MMTTYRNTLKSLIQLMRWHRPVGFFLLGFPIMWALWFANKGIPDSHLLGIFILGIVCMRSAGCVINDIADRHIDRHVERTQYRPLVRLPDSQATSPSVTDAHTQALSVQQAIITFIALCLIALYLVMQLNVLSRYIAVIALLLTVWYPFTKRWFWLPQLILGLSFASGVLMAYAATLNRLPPIAWYLFTITTVWALIYDTQYAMVDRNDDIKIGLYSTAILFGRYDRLAIACLQILMLGLLCLLGHTYHLNHYFYSACIGVACLFAYHLMAIWGRDRQKCFAVFLNQTWIGLIIWLGIIFSMI